MVELDRSAAGLGARSCDSLDVARVTKAASAATLTAGTVANLAMNTRFVIGVVG